MPVMTQTFARNMRKQVVVLSSDPKGTEQIEWQPAGDPSGDDVQLVPESIQRLASYQRLKNKGIVVEISEEDAQAALGLQTTAFETRTQAASEKIKASVVHEEKRDILSLECVGPDARNEGKCGVPVPVTEATKNDQPPLCNQHIGLQAQFVPTDTENGRVWSRAGLGPRETA